MGKIINTVGETKLFIPVEISFNHPLNFCTFLHQNKAVFRFLKAKLRLNMTVQMDELSV